MTRTKPIVIRLTPEEWQRFDAAAKRAGIGLGPWLRMLGLREAGKAERPGPAKRGPRKSW